MAIPMPSLPGTSVSQLQAQYDQITADLKRIDEDRRNRLIDDYTYYRIRDNANSQRIHLMDALAKQQMAPMPSYTTITSGSLQGFGFHQSSLAPLQPLPQEDAFGEVVAWRCWALETVPFLTSTYMRNHFWLPNAVEEASEVGDQNRLGFHAWRTERQATMYTHECGSPVVIGTVKLWGDVVHHEFGYRAQFAKIRSLDHLAIPFIDWRNNGKLGAPIDPSANSFSGLLDAVRKHYGVMSEAGK